METLRKVKKEEKSIKIKIDEQKSLIDVLLEKGICFAVCVNLNSFIRKGVDTNSRDYFVIAVDSDIKTIKSKRKSKINPVKHKELRLYKSEDYSNVFAYDLPVDDIVIFKEHLLETPRSKFVKVRHSKDGRVYELRDNSFKARYESVEAV